jgi:hypothetical protein
VMESNQKQRVLGSVLMFWLTICFLT